ncbi:MAG TPA: sialidase family protein [Pyrinomonadaceae bacterium]|nr:sialidase family protein [Pyrinomonadaceae bacterium]
MNRRSVFLLVVIAALILAGVGPSSIIKRTRAQGFFGAQRWPAIDVDNNDNLYLMMSVATAPASEHRPHSQIFFAMSTDSGVNWDNAPQTRNLTKSPGEAFGPSLAVNRHGKVRVYVTYTDNSSGTTQAFLISSKKRTKFRAPLCLTPRNGGSFAPRVALDSNETVNVVWGDTNDGRGKILLAQSTDLGLSFSQPLDVSRSSGVAFDPEIAVDPSDAINVAWQDTAPGKSVIMFARSTDHGRTFSQPKQISTGTGAATEAAIATDTDGRISLAWVDDTPGHSEAFYARSTDNGASFSNPVQVTNFPTGDIHKPTLTTFRNIVYFAFQNGDLFGEEQIKGRQVYLIKSEDAGVSFGQVEQVSSAINSQGRAHSPAMVVDSQGMLHIVWIDSSVVGNDEGLLFYSRSPDGHKFTDERGILALI